MKLNLEQKTAQFIKDLEAQKNPPLYTLSPADARKVLDNAQKKPKNIPAQIEDRTISAGSLGEISIRIIRPETARGPLPVALYFHGGGWILGNTQTHDRLVREIAVNAQIAVAFVNYTLSPEAQFPVPIEQAYAATSYVAQHGKELNLDVSKIVVMGDSVGGNMATVVALLAKERGGPKIDYQILLYPVTDGRMNTESYKQFAQGPWLTKKAMEWFWDAYLPDTSKRTNPLASPLLASIDQLKGMPATLLITDENDVLRDEGEAYAHKLMEAGVPVTVVRVLGTCHDFAMLNALADTPAARLAVDLIVMTIKKHFSDL